MPNLPDTYMQIISIHVISYLPQTFLKMTELETHTNDKMEFFFYTVMKKMNNEHEDCPVKWQVIDHMTQFVHNEQI